MSNKYQEALDKIKSCTNIIIDKGENYTLVKNQVPQECFDSLQELIDDYNSIAQLVDDDQYRDYCKAERYDYIKLVIEGFEEY